MTLEQLVPTLDLCQQLKDAGFPQDTAAFVWAAYENADYGEWRVRERNRTSTGGLIGSVAAPTAGELMDAIIAKHPRADIVSMRGRGGRYWRIYPSGGWEMNEEPIDANSKDSSLAQLAALVLEVAG